MARGTTKKEAPAPKPAHWTDARRSGEVRGLAMFGLWWRVLRAATRRFLADDCFMRANSIAYSIVFSIIPFLAVLVRYADVDKDTIRTYLARFMAAYGMSDITEFALILNEILDRAAAIATVGAVIMIVSATNLLSHLEDSFNYIYRAASSRPLIYRFSIFVSSLVVVPAGIIFASGLLGPLMSRLQAPALIDVAAGEHGIWMAGSDGLLRYRTAETNHTVDLSTRVSHQADFRDIVFDVESGRSGHYYQIVAKQDPIIRLESSDLSEVHRVAVLGRTVYAVSETGALFYSRDAGRSWDYRLMRFVETELRQALIEDVHLAPDGTALILATLGTRSLLLTGTVDRGFRLRRLDGVFNRFFEVGATGGGEGRTVLYMTGNGSYLVSNDLGNRWTTVETRYGRRRIQIETLRPHPGGGLLLGGLSGALWLHGPNGQVFANLRANGRDAIHGIHWEADGSGFVYGSGELLRYTPDNGRTWLRPQGPVLRGVSFNGHVRLEDGSFLFVGERETIAVLRAPQVLQTLDEQGHPTFRMEPVQISSYPWARSLLLRVVLSLLFFSIVLAAFVLGYRVLPNAPVHWRPALMGGALTATALVAFILGFRYWIVTFSSSTVIIYGMWAVIPVGMLLILVSTQIVLFGLELAYVIQHPYLYEADVQMKAGSEPRDYVFWNCLLMTTLVYWAMYRERHPLTNSRALPHFENDLPTLIDTRKRLVEHKIFAYDSSLEEYYPSRPPTEIKVTDIEAIALSDVIDVPPHARSGPFGRRFGGISKKLHERLHRAGGKTTIADLLVLFDEPASRA